MRNFIYKFMIPIYHVNLMVTFDHQAYKNYVARYEASRIKHFEWRQKGIAALCGHKILVYVERDAEGYVPVDTLAHEAYHAANFVCELTGMEVDVTGSNEHVAYLISHITTVILDALNLENKRLGIL